MYAPAGIRLYGFLNNGSARVPFPMHYLSKLAGVPRRFPETVFAKVVPMVRAGFNPIDFTQWLGTWFRR